MRLEPCSFCSSTVYPGRGTMFVRNDCKVFRFCRSKCLKNFKKKRNPRKVKWTKAHRIVKGKEMIVDGALDIERQRNVPVRYDRNKIKRTVETIRRAAQIRQRRELVCYRSRVLTRRALCERITMKRLVTENKHLLPTQTVKNLERHRVLVSQKERILA